MTDARKSDIRQHVETNHQRLFAVVATLTPADFQLSVYGGQDPGKWRVRTVIAHLEAAGSRMLYNARAIASGEDPLPSNFHLAHWNRSTAQKAAKIPADIILDSLQRIHQEWIEFLEEIPVPHLHRRGRHGLRQ